ncbi:molybdate ABC transporter substrate-binding protein [Aeromicrobium massiliense]|uniref:molybdate ABC transporter substrate-binding protein n=1 Tax=Aeromicrobium massiliense TaxID=1464554 RepID=UPI0005782FF1|nr:molybdate ABC transporter substrate-binding protein [Aeromicrobium massiliense]
MRRALAVVLALGLVAGCSGGDAGRRTVTVLAAASLTEPFTALAERLEEQDPGLDVRLSFAGSADLVAQVEAGAPADVLATADEASMARVPADLLDGEPVTFATNRLQVVVPPGNPGRVRTAADLARVDTVLCARAVPCGALAHALLDDLGVRVRPVSEEQSVKDVLGKVASGEADAGLVYVSDARAAGDRVETVDVEGSEAHLNRYRLAALAGGDAEVARRWLDLVSSGEGRAVLRDAGLGAP